MVYRILRLVIALIVLIVLITLIGEINLWAASAVVMTVTLFILLLIFFGSLLVVLEGHDKVSQWHIYRQYILEPGLGLRDRLKADFLPFIHGGLIMLTPPFVFIALMLPYVFSVSAVFHLIAASYQFSENISAVENASLPGALAVVIAIIAISLTMLPVYVGMARRLLADIRLSQSRYLKGSFTFSDEELCYRDATDRLFAQDPKSRSPNYARCVLDKLRAGHLDAYRYTRESSDVVVSFSPPIDPALPDTVCYIAHSVAYRPSFMTKLPRRKRSWQHIFISLIWLAIVVTFIIYGFFLSILAIWGMNWLLTHLVAIYFPA